MPTNEPEWGRARESGETNPRHRHHSIFPVDASKETPIQALRRLLRDEVIPAMLIEANRPEVREASVMWNWRNRTPPSFPECSRKPANRPLP